MNNIKEIEESIQILIKNPHAFGWADFGDRGNGCTGPLDRMNMEENSNYAQTYAAVLQAMPKYSDLHRKFAPVLAQELELKRMPRYDYMIKILTRSLMGIQSSETVDDLCRLAAKAQKYMQDTGKTKLESMDMAHIM